MVVKENTLQIEHCYSCDSFPVMHTPKGFSDVRGKTYIPTTLNHRFYSDIFLAEIYCLEEREGLCWLTKVQNSEQSIYDRHITKKSDFQMVDGKLVEIEIQVRKDLLFHMNYTLISSNRAKKPGKSPGKKPLDMEQERLEKEKCFFEPSNINQTPQPREFHPELEIGGYIPVSVPNKFSFTLDGKVNCFTNHEKKSLDKLDGKDFYNYLTISTKNARFLKEGGCEDMFNIINFGQLGGNSQPHPHFQDGALPDSIITHNSREREIYKSMQRYWKDPFAFYMNIIKQSTLFGFENDCAFIIAPFAPRFPDELEVIVKPQIGDFSELNVEQSMLVGNAIAKTINFLVSQRGVTDLNIVAHQKRLSEQTNYRLHFHLLPRNKNVLAAVEEGLGVYVVDTYPEDSARALREYIEKEKA